jgi:hypothetical protein
MDDLESLKGEIERRSLAMLPPSAYVTNDEGNGFDSPLPRGDRGGASHRIVIGWSGVLFALTFEGVGAQPMVEPRRSAAWTGIAATVVVVVGAAVGGTMPTSRDSADRALLMTLDHRSKYLASMWIIGFGMALSLVFVVALTVVARREDRSDQPWSAVALAAGIATFALGAAGVACVSSAAYRADTRSADSARSLWDLYAAMINMSKHHDDHPGRGDRVNGVCDSIPADVGRVVGRRGRCLASGRLGVVSS